MTLFSSVYDVPTPDPPPHTRLTNPSDGPYLLVPSGNWTEDVPFTHKDSPSFSCSKRSGSLQFSTWVQVYRYSDLVRTRTKQRRGSWTHVIDDGKGLVSVESHGPVSYSTLPFSPALTPTPVLRCVVRNVVWSSVFLSVYKYLVLFSFGLRNDN